MNNLEQFDERSVSWKILLPVEPGARILAVGLNEGALASLARSYEKVDQKLIERVKYDAVILGNTAKYNSYSLYELCSTVKPDGVIVNANTKNVGSCLYSIGFKYSKYYAALPWEKPRIFIPLASRRLRHKGLSFHLPGSYKAYLGLIAAKCLSLLGMSRHLMKHSIGIHVRNPSVFDRRGFSHWLSKGLDKPIDDLVIYAGSESSRRKITALAVTKANEMNTVVKIADSVLASRALKQESEALKIIAASSLADQVPILVIEKRWNSLYIQAQEEILARNNRQVTNVTNSHIDFLSKLSAIERKVMPLKNSSTWKNIKAWVDTSSLGFWPQSMLSAVDKVLSPEYANMLIVCHRTHGDFAPWNIRIKCNGKLNVYDWEDSLSDGLALTDVFHFLFMQASRIGPWPGSKKMLTLIKRVTDALVKACDYNDINIMGMLTVWIVKEYMEHPNERLAELAHEAINRQK